MPSPALPRPFAACSAALLSVALLGGCGNRGELYLEPDTDADIEADLERLGVEADAQPDGAIAPELDATPAPLGTPPIVPEGGVAPSVEPADGAASDPALVGDGRDGDDDGKRGSRARSEPDGPTTDDAAR